MDSGSRARLARCMAAACALAAATSSGAWALTIQRTPFSFGPPSAQVAGGGSLETVFDAAADWWEAAIQDPFELSIVFGWDALDAGTLGFANVVSGPPATFGTIRFDNDDFSWFADATPFDHAEFQTFDETFADLGGGLVNVGRQLGGAIGFAAGRYDLLSIALHEIGHVLGLLDFSFNGVPLDDPLVIEALLPHAGTAIQTTLTGGGHVDPAAHPDALMVPYFDAGERTLPSAIDILGAAQVSGFTDVVLDPLVLPEPGAWALLAGAALAALGREGLSRRAPAQTAARARSRSAIRSSASSMPQERRTRESVMP